MNQGGEGNSPSVSISFKCVLNLISSRRWEAFQKHCRRPENSETTVEPGRACVDKSASESAFEESGDLKTSGEFGVPDLAS